MKITKLAIDFKNRDVIDVKGDRDSFEAIGLYEVGGENNMIFPANETKFFEGDYDLFFFDKFGPCEFEFEE